MRRRCIRHHVSLTLKSSAKQHFERGGAIETQKRQFLLSAINLSGNLSSSSKKGVSAFFQEIMIKFQFTCKYSSSVGAWTLQYIFCHAPAYAIPSSGAAFVCCSGLHCTATPMFFIFWHNHM